MRPLSRSFLGALGTISLAAVASSIGGCEDSSSGATVDAGTLDSSFALPDSATFDSGAVDANDGRDAADVQVQTNNASWSSAAGLPSAACAPWTLIDSAAAHDPSLAAGVMTVATDAVAENMYWIQQAAALTTPTTLVVEARMRFVSGSSTQTPRAPGSIVIRYGSPLRAVPFYIGSGEVFLNSADLTRGQTANMATSDALHTYRIEIDTTTHAVTVKCDTVEILTGTAYLDPESGATASVLFGEASLLATGTTEWASFTHNAHVLSTCP